MSLCVFSICFVHVYLCVYVRVWGECAFYRQQRKLLFSEASVSHSAHRGVSLLDRNPLPLWTETSCSSHPSLGLWIRQEVTSYTPQKEHGTRQEVTSYTPRTFSMTSILLPEIRHKMDIVPKCHP